MSVTLPPGNDFVHGDRLHSGQQGVAPQLQPASRKSVLTASVTSAYADADPSNNSSSAVLVASNPAPAVADLAVDKAAIGPPSHKMIDVALSYGISDNCGAVSVSVTVSSNQPIDGTGDGDTAPDWEIVNDHLVRLRAERSGTSSDDRIYTITVAATDSAGGSSSSSASVRVPKSSR